MLNYLLVVFIFDSSTFEIRHVCDRPRKKSSEKAPKSDISPSPGITIDFAKLLYNSDNRKGNFHLLYIRFKSSQRRFKFELLAREFGNGNFG